MGVKASGANMPKQSEHKRGIKRCLPPMSKMSIVLGDLREDAGPDRRYDVSTRDLPLANVPRMGFEEAASFHPS